LRDATGKEADGAQRVKRTKALKENNSYETCIYIFELSLKKKLEMV
jgi:hypothetical protein